MYLSRIEKAIIYTMASLMVAILLLAGFIFLHRSLPVRYSADPLAEPDLIINTTDGDSTAYLQELSYVPSSILRSFYEKGWTFIVSPELISNLGDKYDSVKGATGVTCYADKLICASSPISTVHEMGHYLDHTLSFPEDIDVLYQIESEAAESILGTYSTTNRNEYFEFWVKNRNDIEQMKLLQSKAPLTYKYFVDLEANGWKTGYDFSRFVKLVNELYIITAQTAWAY